ncbi:phosphatase PAP2 family protein [Clostridium kluyveri]|uniref:Phosphatase n=1 Tax=Clostridium kluyveri TaxID=1534 RepID=A0A1L5F9V3_CLOKL|nr:phosphatase PAP2 family protein [Clostridium kluyveri]APM39795.1 phosphatase [Clostridium kluyveri]UZQ50043.1 phosphatase [Clostridium kluyveri]
MKRLRNFIKTHRHFYWVLMLIPILIWFKYLEVTLVPEYMVYSPLDDLIPMVPVLIVPYLLWFPYIAYGVIYTGIYSKRDFYRLLIFLAGGMSIAYIIYMIYPNGQELRPAVLGNDPFSFMVRLIYETDTPTNICPSVHVINSIAVHSALCHSKAFERVKYGKQKSGILMVLICLSTVMIKQHSIVDVAGGIMISVLFNILLYHAIEPKEKRKEYSLSHCVEED